MSTESVRILAWDPSLRNLGMAVGESTDSQLTITQATTFYVDKMVESHGLDTSWDEDENIRRLCMLEHIVPKVIANYKPDLMVIEKPIYNNLNPKTLMIQMLAIGALERIAHQHRITFREGLSAYMPNQIKLAVGVPATKEAFKDKKEVTRALLRLERDNVLQFEREEFKPLSIDEHANDAVAMVWTKHKELHDVIGSNDR